MLKIKDNVDLKDLEKYGFNFHEDYYDENGNLKYYFAGQNLYIFEKENGEFDRTFDNTDFGFSMYDIDLLYDLIKADLVEKVGDNNE